VAEVKTRSLKVHRHKLECIPKLRFRIIKERRRHDSRFKAR